jgi:hypothetical protein
MRAAMAIVSSMKWFKNMAMALHQLNVSQLLFKALVPEKNSAIVEENKMDSRGTKFHRRTVNSK